MNVEASRPARRRRTTPGRRKTWWPGWIWAIPLAAVGIVVWLMLRALSSRGVGVTVVFDDAAGMAANSTKVLYRGLEVGTVTDLSLAKDGHHVLAHLDIDADMRPYVNAGTRFYLIGANPSFMDPASLKALVSGPTIELVPGRGPLADRFTGIEGNPPEPLEVAIPYAATFSGAWGGIQVGSPVMLGGFQVGEVASTQLVTDAKSGGIETRVVLLLDPTRFHIEGAVRGENWTQMMNSTLEALVRHGLRAGIARTPPLVGAPQVALDMQPEAPPANLAFGARYPAIPTQTGGGLGAFTEALGHLPIEQIADNVRAVTGRLRALADSPQLDDSIRHLDRSLAELDRTMSAAGPQVAPTLATVRETVAGLRRTATDIDATAAAAHRVINSSAAAPGSSMQQALRELTDAARSIRALADYIDQHPEALIRGRQ